LIWINGRALPASLDVILAARRTSLRWSCEAAPQRFESPSLRRRTSMMVKSLIARDQAASRCALTEQGRAVLAALLANGER
jgi:hypothetical protein